MQPNPFAIQLMNQMAGQGMTEFSPLPQRTAPQAPPQQQGGFPMQPTANPTMDPYMQWAAQRESLLNQARQQDLAAQWQRAVSSQNSFGSRYQRGRLVGQQLFNDILAPMMAGPGAGGAQGAYEFIKDTNKRIDEAMTTQTTERLKTAQTLNSLAEIAGKADKAEWDRLGATIRIHNEAARLNDFQQKLAFQKARTDKAVTDAQVAAGTAKDKIAFQKARTEEQQGKVQIGVEKLTEAKAKAKGEYQKLYGEYIKNYQAYTMAPSKIAASQALVAKREAEKKLAEIKQINEQIKGNSMREGASQDAALNSAKVATEQGRAKTEASRGKYWANKASGVDPKQQSQVASIVSQFKAKGMPREEMLSRVNSMKDPAQKRLYLEALDEPETFDSDDEKDE